MMGIDIAGTALASSSGLVANASVGQVMKMGTTGILQRYLPGQPMFRAGAGGANAWVNFTSAAWQAVVLPNTNVNIGSCYNTSNGRFTVPVDGVYLVTAHTYVLGPAAGWYIHPMFWVNGSSNTRRPSAGALHRMRGHGNTAGYQTDTEIAEIILMVAGDYVQFYNYSNAANQYLPQYSRYEGYLLG